MKNDINRQEYPFLDLILWDTKKQKFTPEEIFYLCEKRYRYFDERKLSSKERQLLQRLIKTVGKGAFNHS